MVFFGTALLKASCSLGSAASTAWEHAGPAAVRGKQLAKAFGAIITEQITAATAHRNPLPAYEDASPDWAILSQFGEDVGRQVGVTTGEAWDALLSGGSALSNLVQDKGYKFEFKEEDTEGFAEHLKRWILEHPAEAATLLACLAAAPAALTVTPAILGLVGFTPLGPAAGSLAAAMQSAMGPVAAGGAFAILQSAAMSGYGVFIVNAMAATGAATGTCSIAAASFMRDMRGDDANSDSANETH